MSSPLESAASRLCRECGLCCNGVMFHNVRVLSNDTPRELVALGFKLYRKHKELIFLQPCRAYQGAQCTIYAQRPERCQLFKCRQLLLVASGETDEAGALERIREALGRVELVNELLRQSGPTHPKKPLTQRYEKITAEPVGEFSDPQTVELRHRLESAMGELEAQLIRDFRP
jgi:Fe-S-cluster containining protein